MTMAYMLGGAGERTSNGHGTAKAAIGAFVNV